MSVEIFGKLEFEKALAFLPVGFVEAKPNGQVVYHAQVVSQIKCPECGRKFFPTEPGTHMQSCTHCGYTGQVSSKTILPGELYLAFYTSINSHTGKSRDTGQDSIRIVLMRGDGEPVAKEGHYVTRVKGWEGRLKDKVRGLWHLALSLPRCPDCKKISRVYKCKTGKNAGKRFLKCWTHNNWLGWLKEVA